MSLFVQNSAHAQVKTSLGDLTLQGENFFEFGFLQEHSNNLHKTDNNKIPGYQQTAYATLGYNNFTATNTLIANYTADYARYSEDDIADEGNLSGSLNLNQHIFSENSQLDLAHFRHSYLLNQNDVDLPGNNGHRDVFTLSPMLRLPYSSRAGFELRYTYTAVRLSENKPQNTDRQSARLSWYNDLNNSSKLQINTKYTYVDYPYYNIHYDQTNSDIGLTGVTRRGDYLIKTGYSHLMLRNQTEQGITFEASYRYQFSKQSIAIAAHRQLTDSSIGLGQDATDNNNINFNSTQLQWIERIELSHGLLTAQHRLNNSFRFYYNQTTPLLTKVTEPRAGINNNISWLHTKKLTSNITLDYSQLRLDEGGNKQDFSFRVGSGYKITPNFSVSLAANYSLEKMQQQDTQYDEWRYIGKISFRY